MAEPIEMLSGGSREYLLHEDVDAPMGKGTFGVSGWLKSIVKHRILGLGKRVSCAKASGPILAIYMSYVMFFAQGIAFWESRWLHLH